ncbi:MAG: glycosyltransferase family 2 protein [Candidatus Pacebacteria bacterium]|nr:glycosyltransferase family 2 protein [Candidatus Paceibacterota bacterium]
MEESARNSIPVSAFMITFNNERTLERALESLTWADEIVVVDSFSTDRTPEIARQYADTFLQREWPGFRDQYQFAAENCTHEWVVFADADEVVTDQLADEIRAELQQNSSRSPDDRIHGYYANRTTWYIDRWIKHGGWVPDREIRLYNRNKGSWQGGLHACVKVEGREGCLRHIYLHYTYADIGDHLRTINRYSQTAAKELHEANKRFSLLRLLTRPPWRFVRDYFLKRGFLDGVPGLILAVNTMFYVFAKESKLYERQLGDKQE